MAATLREQVDALRQEINAAKEELEWVDSSLLPKEEVKEKIKAELNKVNVKDFDYKLGHQLHPGTNTFSELFAIGLPAHTSTLQPSTVNILPALVWLFGVDQIAERIDARIDARDYSPGPAIASRPAKVKNLTAALNKLERKEEALIEQAEASSVQIGRREDADPAAVLDFDPAGTLIEIRPMGGGSALPAVANAVASGPTSPGPGLLPSNASAPSGLQPGAQSSMGRVASALGSLIR